MSTPTSYAVASRDPPHVVIADDDAEIRCMLSAALRHAGSRVAEARSGLELLSVIASISTQELAPPDVIVSDVRMPMFTGIDALRNARGLGLDVPFILITAYRDKSVELFGQHLGATALFDKPFDIDLLVQEVLAAASRSKALF